MEAAVYTKTYESPDIDRREILRYTHTKEETPEIAALLDSCLQEAMPFVQYRVCWAEYPVVFRDAELDLGFSVTQSAALRRNLKDCSRLILFAATAGYGIDRLIQRYSGRTNARALLLQAIGNERVESLCDAFNQEIREQALRAGCTTVPRFSPGYGDFPIEIQRDIIRVLDCSRTVGITLNDSLLMRPSKSVTAVIGIRQA